MWGVGVVQEIDAAAMSVWLKYRQFGADGQDGRDKPNRWLRLQPSQRSRT